MKNINSILYIEKFALFLFYTFIMASCASPPDYPIEPAIELISISKDTLARNYTDPSDPVIFRDTTFVTFSFTDGDGDIGDQDSILLFAIDSREGQENLRKIPFVPELGASNGIKGEITFRLFSTCCIFPPDLFLDGCNDEYNDMPYDELTYDIYIKDRAGNQSNVITTPPIFIRCFE